MPVHKSFARSLLRLMPLAWSRVIRYRYYTGRWPRLRHPLGLNEKINWRILHDRRDVWDWCCDKLASQERAALLSPGILIPEVVWSGSDPAELAQREVTGRWIYKSNRSSKAVLVGVGTPDIDELKRTMAGWDDFQWSALGEYGYRNARDLAVLERWIGDTDEPPADYKVLVFDGVARYVHVHTSRFSQHRASLYTRDWIRVEADQNHILPHEEDAPKPPHLDELLRRAEQLSGSSEFVRVDLYDTVEGVWFGEVSPYAWSGFRPFSPAALELELGSLWTLPDL